MEHNELIDTLVKEVVRRLNRSSKSALVLFTGVYGELEEEVNDINKLKDDGWNIKTLLPSKFQERFSSNQVSRLLTLDQIYIEDEVFDEEVFLKNIEVIIIPVLTIDVLAKSALGIADTVMTRLIAAAIMTGIPIVAVKDACDVENYKNVNASYAKMPKAYIKKIKGYIDDLLEYGVKLIDSKSIYRVLANNLKSKSIESKCEVDKVISKKLITTEDVLLAQRSGATRICIAKNAIVTALAKDSARELGVEIQCI